MANKITYTDKIQVNPKKTHVNQFWADDANEIKAMHNINDDRIDALTVAGAKTYQTLADLNAVSPVPDDGTPAKVANDPTNANNGYYSVVSGVWVKDDDIYANGYETIKNLTDFDNAIASPTYNNWIILEDFALDANKTLPSNVTLTFNGGIISGAYTITGNETNIVAPILKIFETNVLFAGSWKSNEVNVEWFGASINSQDNKTEIQKTFDFASNSGMEVKFLEGTYYVDVSSGPILIADNMTISGVSMFTTIIEKTDTGAWGVFQNEKFTSTTETYPEGWNFGLKMNNLRINANGNNITENYIPSKYINKTGRCIDLGRIQDVQIENCWFDNGASDCFRTRIGKKIKVNGCYFSNSNMRNDLGGTSGNGCTITNSDYVGYEDDEWTAQVTNCWAFDNADFGINSWECPQVLISNNLISNNGFGTQTPGNGGGGLAIEHQAHFSKITNNILLNNTGGVILSRSENCAITDNIIANSISKGGTNMVAINVKNIRNTIISDNTIHNASSMGVLVNYLDESGTFGNEWNGDCYGLSINNNTISSTVNSIGIKVENLKQSQIINNRVSNTGEGGIRSTYVSPLTSSDILELDIINNQVYNCGSTGIYTNVGGVRVNENKVLNSVGVGIIITGAAQCEAIGNRCTDNQLTKTQTFGMQLANCGSILAKDNYCKGNLSGEIAKSGTTVAYISASTNHYMWIDNSGRVRTSGSEPTSYTGGELISQVKSGTTGNRPTANSGEMYFDTTLGYAIWFDGTNWVDSTGVTR